MTGQQLQQTLANKAVGGPAELFSPERIAGVLSQGARALRRREDAAEAWMNVAEPQWLAQTAIAGVTDNQLVISVADPTLLYHLTQRAPALQRELARRVGGIRRIKFTPAGQRHSDTHA